MEYWETLLFKKWLQEEKFMKETETEAWELRVVTKGKGRVSQKQEWSADFSATYREHE